MFLIFLGIKAYKNKSKLCPIKYYMSYEIFEIKQHLLYITDVTEMDLGLFTT